MGEDRIIFDAYIYFKKRKGKRNVYSRNVKRDQIEIHSFHPSIIERNLLRDTLFGGHLLTQLIIS